MTYEFFLAWVSAMEDQPASLDRVRWIASYCIAMDAMETFKAKDWALIWYDQSQFRAIETQEDVQAWLTEKMFEFTLDEGENAQTEFLSWVETLFYN